MLLRTPLDLGAAIRDQRHRLNLGQDDLAKRVGVSRKWIIDVEKGKPRAEIGLLLRTLDVLGLRLNIDQSSGAKGDAIPAITAPDIDSDLARAQDQRS